MKKYLIMFLSVCLIFSITGCAKKSTASLQESNIQASGQQRSRAQFERADLMGEVSEITGNEITLKLLKIPERPQGAQNKGNQNNTSTAQSPGQAGGGTGTRPEGANGMGKGNMKREYTGEEKTLIIPVGIKVYTAARGQNGIEQKEVSLDEIKKGSILQIYYADDGKTIEKVSMNSMMGGRGNAAGN